MYTKSLYPAFAILGTLEQEEHIKNNCDKKWVWISVQIQMIEKRMGLFTQLEKYTPV